MIDSLLTNILLRYSLYDENVGYFAKEKGQMAQKTSYDIVII